MSYIIKTISPFASTKLTETGREKIAKGQLTFTSWSIGDSEINYNREFYVENSVVNKTSKILRPKDRQSNIKYFINNNVGNSAFNFGTGDVRCIKATINNEATERGFFSGNSLSEYSTITGDTLSNYIVANGTLSTGTISGGTTIDLGVNTVVEGDLILLKTGYTGFTNSTPTPHLWYKAQSINNTIITVDRNLPNLTGDTTFIIYKGGEIYDLEDPQVAYWDSGTLSFDASGSTITSIDVPIWNMNIPFSEDIMGTTGTTEYEKHINYGSYDFIGEIDNYLYNSNDTFKKSAAIIHYSNKTISNLYGEFFHIDGESKHLKLHLPTLMYHRRNSFVGDVGSEMGMTFVATGTSISVGANGLSYIPLVEDSTLVTGGTQSVGRVYPNLKIIVIDDPEIIAAMSYKSNRNWTLPSLNLNLVNPSGGVGSGMLPSNSTIYVTYSLDNDSVDGLTPSLPNQNFTTITNTSSSSKDVQFNIEDIGLLNYFRDSLSSDGFYANNFKVIYQITTNGERPLPNNWKEIDFSSSVSSGGMVSKEFLEIQNPLATPIGTPTLQLTSANTNLSDYYSVIDTLSMAPNNSPELLQFGDERFFYGNVETFIGATIFKTIFKIAINSTDFNSTSNISRNNDVTTNPPNLKVSEVGIYDSDGDLVIISKLSVPVELTPGKTIILELSMDF